MPRLGIHSARSSSWMPGSEKSSCRQTANTSANGIKDTIRANDLISRVLSLGKNATRSPPKRGMKSSALSSIALSSYNQDYQPGHQAKEQHQRIRLKQPRLDPAEQPAADDEGSGDAVDRAVHDAQVKLADKPAQLARRPRDAVDDAVHDGAIDPGHHHGQSDGAADKNQVVEVIDVVAPLQQHPNRIKRLDKPAAGDEVELVNRQRQQHPGHPHDGGHAEHERVELGPVGMPVIDQVGEGTGQK